MKQKSIIMLMLLLMVLMISFLVMAQTSNLQGLQNVPAGYFISEELYNGIIERYPELEQIFENAMKVESGSYMNDSTTINLGNKINELKADRDKWKMKFEVSQGALNEERIVVQEMKTADEKVKELQAIQIQDWKLLYEKGKRKNLIEKAGLAAIIALIVARD